MVTLSLHWNTRIPPLLPSQAGAVRVEPVLTVTPDDLAQASPGAEVVDLERHAPSAAVHAGMPVPRMDARGELLEMRDDGVVMDVEIAEGLWRILGDHG